MRMCPYPIVFLAFSYCWNRPVVARALEGCPDPRSITKALSQLRLSPWRDVSVARLQTMWPNELLGIDCNTDVCSSVGSKGRVINGHYECGETFFFNVTQNKNGAWQTELNNVVIHYSSRKKEEVVMTARMLASATGLSEAEAATIGQDSDQSFDWENDDKSVLSGLNVTFSQTGTVWTVSLNLSRFRS